PSPRAPPFAVLAPREFSRAQARRGAPASEWQGPPGGAIGLHCRCCESLAENSTRLLVSLALQTARISCYRPPRRPHTAQNSMAGGGQLQPIVRRRVTPRPRTSRKRPSPAVREGPPRLGPSPTPNIGATRPPPPPPDSPCHFVCSQCPGQGVS